MWRLDLGLFCAVPFKMQVLITRKARLSTASSFCWICWSFLERYYCQWQETKTFLWKCRLPNRIDISPRRLQCECLTIFYSSGICANRIHHSRVISSIFIPIIVSVGCVVEFALYSRWFEQKNHLGMPRWRCFCRGRLRRVCCSFPFG